MGIASISSSLAFAFGPNLAIVIGNRFEYSYIFYIAASCALLAGVFVTFIPYEGAGLTKKRISLNIKGLIEKRAIVYAMVICISSAVCSVSNSFIAIYGGEFALGNIGWYFTIGSIFAMLSKYLAGRIADKFGVSYAVLPGVLLTISLIILGSIRETMAMVMFIAATILLNLGTAGLDPVLQAKVLGDVTDERRGAAASTFYLGADMGQAIGPITGGMLVQKVGYGSMYLAYIVPLIVAAVVFVFFRRRKINGEG